MMAFIKMVSVVFLFKLVEFATRLQEKKHVLRVASELRQNFLIKLGGNGRYDSYKGFVKDFCDELVNILGYQYEMVAPSLRNQDGTHDRANASTASYWDEVFGMLIRNEADLAFGNTEITTERAQVVDFSAPVLSSRFSIIYKIRNDSHGFENSKLSSAFWTIFRPFPITVWISFTVVVVLYVGLMQFHNICPTRLHLHFPRNRKLIYCNKISKTFLAIWLLFLFASYISNYCAYKVVQAAAGLHKKPETLMDLAAQKEVKIGWLARGPVEQFFRNTANEAYQKVYKKNVGRDWFSTEEDGMNKVVDDNGKFAFISDSVTAGSKAESDCSLYALPQEFGPVRHIAVATPIGSPLRERINQAVLSLSEQGIVEDIQNRWFAIPYSSNQCKSTNKAAILDATMHANVEEVSPIFVFAIIGLLLATIAGVLESELLKRKSKSPQPKPPRQKQQAQTELLPKFNLETV